MRAIIIGPPDTPYQFGFFEVRPHSAVLFPVLARLTLKLAVRLQIRERYSPLYLLIDYQTVCSNDASFFSSLRLSWKSSGGDGTDDEFWAMSIQPQHLCKRESVLVRGITALHCKTLLVYLAIC